MDAKAFTAEQEALVKDSWNDMKGNAEALGFQFFSRILDITPAARGMFSFLRDTDLPLDQNPRFKSHAFKVFKMTCESAVQLHEKGKVVVKDVTLKYLGSVHVKNGVVLAHFAIVKQALLETIEAALPQKWNPEMKEAWSTAYDNLAQAIVAEMQLQSSS